MRPKRGHVRLLVALAAPGIVVLSGAALPSQTGFGVAAVRAAAAPASSVVQIVAHPDDDLLFINPDTQQSISRGSPVATVYLTAGEAMVGMHGNPGRTHTRPDLVDPLAYAAARQEGVRAAYAAMAGVPNRWHTALARAGRARVEVSTLAARPSIRLAFVKLPDGKDPRTSAGAGALDRLQRYRQAACVRTFVPDKAKDQFCYSHEDVVRMLTALLKRFGATAVRAQDPSPDPRHTNDHIDHVAAARFADEAVQRYDRGRGRILQVAYRDYNVRDFPGNLTTAQGRAKARIFARYARHDHRVRLRSKRMGQYTRRLRYRWPRGSAWAGITPDGSLQAYAVASGRLIAWTRSPDGTWRGPSRLGGKHLAPGVSVARTSHGLEVFTLDLRTGHVLRARPSQHGESWTAAWQDLGAPATGPSGPPAAVTDSVGRILLFARDSRGGISMRHADGSTGWTPLPVPRERRKANEKLRRQGNVQDELAVAADNERVHVFATTRREILHWQLGKRGRFRFSGAVPGTVPAGPLGLTRAPDGRLTLVYTAWHGKTRTLVQSGSGGAWVTAGAPAAHRLGVTGEPPVVSGQALPPAPVGFVGQAAQVADRQGQMVTLAIGTDGRLYAGTPSGWTPAGD